MSPTSFVIGLDEPSFAITVRYTVVHNIGLVVEPEFLIATLGIRLAPIAMLLLGIP